MAKINPDTDELPAGEGTKYHRVLFGWDEATGKPVDVLVDVYAVVDGFRIECPAIAHALKKLLAAGVRGKGDAAQDLREAYESVGRAIQIHRRRVKRGDRIRKTAELARKVEEAAAKMLGAKTAKKPGGKK